MRRTVVIGLVLVGILIVVLPWGHENQKWRKVRYLSPRQRQIFLR